MCKWSFSVPKAPSDEGAVSEADWGRESLKAFTFLVNTGKDTEHILSLSRFATAPSSEGALYVHSNHRNVNDHLSGGIRLRWNGYEKRKAPLSQNKRQRRVNLCGTTLVPASWTGTQRRDIGRFPARPTAGSARCSEVIRKRLLSAALHRPAALWKRCAISRVLVLALGISNFRNYLFLGS